MARYIVHTGTGTVIDIDDGCYLLDGENITSGVDIDSEADMIAATLTYGTPVGDLIDAVFYGGYARLESLEEFDDDGIPLYWHNEIGWTTRQNSEVFGLTEIPQVNPPIASRWVITSGRKAPAA